MSTITTTLPPLLRAREIPYRVEQHTLLIPLPNGFGELEVTALDEEEDLIGLVGEDWHLSTRDLAEDSPHLKSAQKVTLFVVEILEGRFLLMEETASGEEPVKWIEDDLEGYLSARDPHSEYRIYNPVSP